MKITKINRRKLLKLGFFTLPTLLLADSLLIEKQWINIKEIILNKKHTHKIIHITDIHHKGDQSYLKKLIEKINKLNPDFVCFTGDIIEKKYYLDESLELLKQIKHPIFGVPGNHDYWSGASFSQISKCFKSTGGEWLVDQEVITPDKNIIIVGSSGKKVPKIIQHDNTSKRVLLVHYPEYITKIKNINFDLTLAGHSHGGQIRLPFWGALIVPNGVGKYSKGLFQTNNGPLYVNPGIGYWHLPIRFCCRPEITIIKI